VDEAHVAPRHHTARSILLAVRAFNPRPGAWAIVDGDRLKIWEAGPSDQRCEPGMAVVSAGAVILGARDGAVELARVQPAGRAPMDALAWMNGRRGEPANLE
jgi:methionyl-tRNA formyltransferase